LQPQAQPVLALFATPEILETKLSKLHSLSEAHPGLAASRNSIDQFGDVRK
jgi:hypothetical protein